MSESLQLDTTNLSVSLEVLRQAAEDFRTQTAPAISQKLNRIGAEFSSAFERAAEANAPRMRAFSAGLAESVESMRRTRIQSPFRGSEDQP